MQQPQPFEKFKELTHYIQHMASTGMVPNGSGWTSFLYELNKVCSAVPEDLSAPASPVEEMPQTENPLASYWFEKARECLVERNEFKAQLSRANDKIKELTESKPSPAIEDEKSVHPIYKGWDSVKLIGRARARHMELIEKGWDWRSFYSGWLEGRSGMLQEMLTEYDASHPAPALIVGEREELFEHPADYLYQIGILKGELAAANALIKEKQQWIDSHV